MEGGNVAGAEAIDDVVSVGHRTGTVPNLKRSRFRRRVVRSMTMRGYDWQIMPAKIENRR